MLTIGNIRLRSATCGPMEWTSHPGADRELRCAEILLSSAAHETTPGAKQEARMSQPNIILINCDDLTERG